MEEILIRDFTGRIIGRIVTESNGDKVAKDFAGRILGRYKKSTDMTVDFTGRIVAHGDVVSSFIR